MFTNLSRRISGAFVVASAVLLVASAANANLYLMLQDSSNAATLGPLNLNVSATGQDIFVENVYAIITDGTVNSNTAWQSSYASFMSTGGTAFKCDITSPTFKTSGGSVVLCDLPKRQCVLSSERVKRTWLAYQYCLLDGLLGSR